MSKKQPTQSKKQPSYPGFTFIQSLGGISEFVLKKNGLRVLHLERPETGVITTNITYLVGSRDEARGETGLAHMLEHMLFKPTVHDIARGEESSSMVFEQETGSILNANTSKDRTTYYFSYPKEHFLRALKIEAERMCGLQITKENLEPERGSVLSEYDIYHGEPDSVLYSEMSQAAFQAHPYGHKIIGHRSDIEHYSVEMLQKFYTTHYRPDNAILMIVGDVTLQDALQATKKFFTAIEKPSLPIPTLRTYEPEQEGLRRVTVERVSQTNLLALGMKVPRFPDDEWFACSALIDLIANGPESILHTELVDKGLAVSVEGFVAPLKEPGLGAIFLTLPEGSSHADIEKRIFALIDKVDIKLVEPLLKKVKAKLLTDELFSRDSSLQIVAELTEYVSAGDWTLYHKTPHILEKITAKKVLASVKQCFNTRNMTIGYFIGTKKTI